MLSWLLVPLFSIALLMMLAIAVFYFNQERLIFFPEKLAEDFSFHFPIPFREANIQLKSGQKINYLVFNSESNQGTILYFHGNAGSLKEWGFVASDLVKHTGWAVWIMDFPGYGKSGGRLPKTEKILLEMGRALRSKLSQEKPHSPVVLFGRSIGSGIATALAAEHHPSGLILEAPYRSIAKLGKEIYPFLPEVFSRIDLDNEKALSAIHSMPVLIIHGSKDEVIPINHSKVLSGVNAEIKLIVIPDANHNNLDSFPAYWPAVHGFLLGLALQGFDHFGG